MEKVRKEDSCEVYCFDEEKVNRVKQQIEEHETLDIVKVFKALADDTRLKVAYALCQEEELCVCDVSNIIGSSTATASHHLRLLRNMGLATYRKEGKLVFYSLHDEHLKQLITLAFAQRKEITL
ncbi:cadmium-sensing regulator CadC [Aneurinibacillus soli]|uniref:Cadmium resistance transcriptional regulatory protein CadC n=1 Tax=Aneurinibacillus soli TaxID=1500254 RepID=A0A0U4WID8_9BACL|nr:metalloregulator ArsR/SmtB family transcription factor [Aneurinibacillus soli]PYE61747.1 cadmium-sensing regulator CadC [Aneurinibacillus soli]BAU28395.1 Cadmium resistance transcriptional regulatory protein CadC [Aneurinibacillus soli]